VAFVQALVAQLLIAKPDDPKQFLVEYLEKTKTDGVLPIVNDQDLDTMFNMFDLTKRGTVSVQQANAALQTIIGANADITSVGVNPEKALSRVEFISSMNKAIKLAVPDAQVKF
jgi:hypothetical protein